MTHSSRGLSRRSWAGVFVGAAALAIAACSSSSTGPWLGGGGSPTQVSNERALAEPPPQLTWVWSQPIYDTGSDNEVTALQDEATITGVYKEGADYHSFTAQCVPEETGFGGKVVDCSGIGFTPVPSASPDADVTYLNASDNGVKKSYAAGYATFPSHTGTHCMTCGILYDNHTGQYVSELQDNNEGSCGVTELLGINNAKVAVGFYHDPTKKCQPQAVEEYLSNNNAVFFNFSVTGAASSEATGIDNAGNVVGTAMVNGVELGWYYHDLHYAEFCVACSATTDTSDTQPTGINWPGGIVGNYTTSSSSISHGFLVQTNTKYQITKINPSYAPIDDLVSNVDYGTVVNSIAQSYYEISGKYQYDSIGDSYGFVAGCTKGCTGNTGTITPQIRAKSRTGPSRPAGLRP